MANKLYAKGAELTFGKLVDWENDDLRVIAMSSAYVVDLDTDEFLADISANALATGVALTSKTITGGVFDADDLNLTLLAGTAKSLVIYLHNANPALAALLVYCDNILNFPMTTAGGVLPVSWPTAGIVSARGR